MEDEATVLWSWASCPDYTSTSQSNSETTQLEQAKTASPPSPLPPPSSPQVPVRCHIVVPLGRQAEWLMLEGSCLERESPFARPLTV